MWTWVYASLLVLIGLRVAASPETLESVYGAGAYPVIARVLGFLFGAWPASASLACVGALVLYVSYVVVQALRHRTRPAFRQLGHVLLRGLAFLAAFFLVNWGYNYGRPGIPQRLGITAEGPRELLPTATLVAEYRRAATAVNALRAGLLPRGSFTTDLQPDSAAALGAGLQRVLRQIDFPTVPLRRLRVLPKGLLLRFGTAGVYSPWTGDPHIDGGLHPLQQAFTATHELAHQQGVTDEGDCNLLAYLAGVNSPDARVRYGAELTYLRYLRAALSRRGPGTLVGLSPKLSERARLDLREIRAAQNRYEEIAPAARDAIYDRYLKTQGVEEGLSSYGRIIDHVVAGRRTRPGLFGADRRGGDRLPR